MSEDLYGLLGVSPQAALPDIKHRYREAVKRCHPDLGSEPERLETFKQISQAYAVLSDPVARAVYDQEIGVVPAGDAAPDPATPHAAPDPDVAARNRAREVREVLGAGRARLVSGDFAGAENAGRLVLRWERQSADAYLLIAESLDGRGRRAEARGCLYLALQIDPSHREARRVLWQMQRPAAESPVPAP